MIGLPEVLLEWLKSNGWRERYKEAFAVSEHHIFEKDVAIIGFNLRLDDKRILAYKKMKHLDPYLNFTNAELKFLDIHDYELTDYHTRRTGQYVEDWFSKEV